MRYDEWQAYIPDEIKGDSLWKLEVYCLGLFVADIAWQDALALSKTLLTRDLANQLYRAVCSISANIAEGYSLQPAKTALVFLNTPWALPAKPVIGITSPAIRSKEKLLNTVLTFLPKLSKC